MKTVYLVFGVHLHSERILVKAIDTWETCRLWLEAHPKLYDFYDDIDIEEHIIIEKV